MDQAAYLIDPWFGFEIPQSCPGVPQEILNPSSMWSDKEAYEKSINQLVEQFQANIKRYQDSIPDEVLRSGPVLQPR